MIQLDATETARALPFGQLVPAIARAARELVSGDLIAPERLVVPTGSGGSLLTMPAVARDIGITKLVTVHSNNPSRGLPAIQGEVIVFESDTGRRLLMLDGPVVTARRTAAVTLLGIDLLAVRPPSSALLIGTGVQSRAHLDALFHYFGVRRFWIAGSSQQRAQEFIASVQASMPDTQITALAAPALNAEQITADVVIALTTSRVPVVPANLPGTTLAIGVGAFRPEMAELPAALLHRRRVVVDYLHGAIGEAGDLLQAGVSWDKVTELSQCLDAVEAERGPTVFKSVGHASWDLAAARVALAARAITNPTTTAGHSPR